MARRLRALFRARQLALSRSRATARHASLHTMLLRDERPRNGLGDRASARSAWGLAVDAPRALKRGCHPMPTLKLKKGEIQVPQRLIVRMAERLYKLGT